MNCGQEGSTALLAQCSALDLASGDVDEHVMACLTVCRRHLGAVRVWLKRRSLDGAVNTIATERWLASYAEINANLSLPVWSTARAG
jgi:hypothetical protein